MGKLPMGLEGLGLLVPNGSTQTNQFIENSGDSMTLANDSIVIGMITKSTGSSYISVQNDGWVTYPTPGHVALGMRVLKKNAVISMTLASNSEGCVIALPIANFFKNVR